MARAEHPGVMDGVIEVALVNNMPDQALAATEAQFLRLVRAGAGARDIRWRRYFLPSVARSDTARLFLSRTHEDVEALYRRGADALIVTGAEPRAAALSDEPYWSEFRSLIDWARENTASTIWSCLAAHAAVLHLDGIERRRLDQKISGVFSCETTPGTWTAQNGQGKIQVPHSRYNGLSRESLERCGYSVSSIGVTAGVDVFWRREPSLFLFLQGHPEYDADTLMKEYRRDVLRFAAGQRGDYPAQPENYFTAKTADALEALRVAASPGEGRLIERKLAEILAVEKKPRARWAQDAARLYRDWLDVVCRERSIWGGSAQVARSAPKIA